MRETGNHVRKEKMKKRERKTEGKSKGQSEHKAKTYKRAKVPQMGSNEIEK